MQTFLPYSSMVDSAYCLDNKRLGKQRIEIWQIYKALTEENYGWKNHPIVKMWKGYELALLQYGIHCCIAWRKRNFKDTMWERFRGETQKYLDIIGKIHIRYNINYPKWFGYEPFHASHRSNLLRKDKDFYGKYNWNEPDNLPYVWITDTKFLELTGEI